MSDLALQEKKPISLKSSEILYVIIVHLNGGRIYPYELSEWLRFSTNYVHAMIYTFSDVLAFNYSFPMLVVHLLNLFNSARNNMILSPRSETTLECTLLTGMFVK